MKASRRSGKGTRAGSLHVVAFFFYFNCLHWFEGRITTTGSLRRFYLFEYVEAGKRRLLWRSVERSVSCNAVSSPRLIDSNVVYRKTVRWIHSIILEIASLTSFFFLQCGHADTLIKCDYELTEVCTICVSLYTDPFWRPEAAAQRSSIVTPLTLSREPSLISRETSVRSGGGNPLLVRFSSGTRRFMQLRFSTTQKAANATSTTLRRGCLTSTGSTAWETREYNATLTKRTPTGFCKRHHGGLQKPFPVLQLYIF